MPTSTKSRPVSFPLQLPTSTPTISIFFLIFSVTLFVTPSHTHQHQQHHQEYHDTSYEGNGGTNSITKMDATLQEMGQPKERPKNLTCHVCYSDKNPDCLNFPLLSTTHHEDSDEGEEEGGRGWIKDYRSHNGFVGFPQQCHNESYVCSVRKFAFSLSNGTGHAPMKTFALKRNCTLMHKCEPGCVVMGERTRIYVCTTCCTTDMCNIGNGGDVRKNLVGVTIVSCLVVLFEMTRNKLCEL